MKPMQIDIGMLSIIVSLLTLVFTGVVRYAVANREKELDSRHDKLDERVQTMDLRLHDEEKATIRQDGKIEKVEEADTRMRDDLTEIKSTMARKEDLLAIVKAMDTMSENVSKEIHALRSSSSGRYAYPGTSGQMGAANVPPPLKK
jgi:hypothetical protein